MPAAASQLNPVYDSTEGVDSGEPVVISPDSASRLSYQHVESLSV